MLLVPLLLVGLAAYLLKDEAFVSKQLQSQLAQVQGWQLEMDGGLALQWGKNSVLEVQGLRLLNPDWPETPLMFSAGTLHLEVQPLQLFRRRLVIDELHLSDCTLYYAENATGTSNWRLQSQDSSQESTEPDQPSFAWSVQQVDITSCDISVSRAGHEQALDIHLEQAALQLDEAANLSAQISGSLDQQQLSLDGNVRPWSALWQGGPLQHEIELQAGEVHLRSTGSIENFRHGKGANLELRFSGPEFALVTDWLALPDFSEGAFDAKLQIIDPENQGRMHLSIAADLGNLEIQGQGELDRWVAPDQGRVELQIQGPNLDALARTFGQDWLVPRPFAIQLKADIVDSQTDLKHFSLQTGTDEITARGHIGAGPGFSGSALEVDLLSANLQPWLEASDAEMLPLGKTTLSLQLSKITADEIRLKADGQLGNQLGQERPLRLQASLNQQDGRMAIKQLDLKLAGDSLNLSGNMNLNRGFEGSEVRSRLQVADLAGTAKWLGLAELPAQPLSFAADLSRPDKGLQFSVTEGSLAGLKFSLSGQIPDIQRPSIVNAQFDLSLQSLGMAKDLLPLPELPDLPLTARGEMRLDGRHHTILEGVKVVLGQSQARLDADLQLSEGLMGSSAQWTMQSEDLAQLWPALSDQFNPGPFALNGEWQRQPAGDVFKALQFRSEPLNLAASGSMSEWTEAGRFDLDVEAHIRDVNLYYDWIKPFLDAHPMAVNFSVSGSKADFTANDIFLSQGENRLVGDLDFAMTERPQISGKIKSKVLDLVPAEQYWSGLQQNKKLQPRDPANNQNGHLFSPKTIDLFGDSAVDLSLDIQIDRLLLSSNEFREVGLQFNLQQQSLQLNRFAFRGIKEGQYSGRLSSQKRGDQTEISFKALAEDLKLGQFGVSGLNAASLPSADIEVDMAGTGKNWQTLAQSLTGRVRWYSEKGRISNSGLSLIFSDLLTQIFTTLNPLSKKSQYTELKCAVYAADFANGKMKLAPVVIQTDQITAFSEGEVDLATEQISLNFRTVAQKGLGISAGSVVNPFFKIGGTLLNPAMQLDVTRGAISGSAMVATAGLSVLFKSMSDRLLVSKQPCADARAAIELRDRGSTPGN